MTVQEQLYSSEKHHGGYEKTVTMTKQESETAEGPSATTKQQTCDTTSPQPNHKGGNADCNSESGIIAEEHSATGIEDESSCRQFERLE